MLKSTLITRLGAAVFALGLTAPIVIAQIGQAQGGGDNYVFTDVTAEISVDSHPEVPDAEHATVAFTAAWAT